MDLFRKSAEQGYPLGILNYGNALVEDKQYEAALIQFEKGARMEEYLLGYPR